MPTPLEIKQEQLAEVRTAISRVLVSQEYWITDGGAQRRLKRADLADLRAMEKDLQTEISRLECGGIRVNYGLPK